jgi:hypothetical protein
MGQTCMTRRALWRVGIGLGATLGGLGPEFRSRSRKKNKRVVAKEYGTCCNSCSMRMVSSRDALRNASAS